MKEYSISRNYLIVPVTGCLDERDALGTIITLLTVVWKIRGSMAVKLAIPTGVGV